MSSLSFFSVVFSLFLLIDPLGNIPLFVVLLENLDRKRQRRIVVRESLIALGTMLFFAFFGNFLMAILDISHECIVLAGGIILFLIAVHMIFPSKNSLQETLLPGDEEPLVFPLAIPLFAGPSVLAVIMVYSHQNLPLRYLLLSITIAWCVSTLILLCAGAIGRFVGRRGIKALEKLMGLILVLISLQMFLRGMKIFMGL